DRGALPRVAAETHAAHVRVLLLELVEHDRGVVGAAVVDDHHVAHRGKARELGEELVDHRGKVLGLVVGRDHHGDVGRDVQEATMVQARARLAAVSGAMGGSRVVGNPGDVIDPPEPTAPSAPRWKRAWRVVTGDDEVRWTTA